MIVYEYQGMHAIPTKRLPFYTCQDVMDVRRGL